MKQVSCQEWKEAVEQCLFTDCLDEHLRDFLERQKSLYNDEQRWRFVYTTVHQWKRGPITAFDSMSLPSYFQGWNIHARLTTFSFQDPCPYTLEQILYWAMLASWILLKEDGKRERLWDFPKSHFDWNLERVFRYPAETCTWLHHQWFLEEIKEIYNRSK